MNATAHTLAPSKEAFDTPLSPSDLSSGPGPTTGRSDTYPDGTHTRWLSPAFRTQQVSNVNGCDSLCPFHQAREGMNSWLSVT